MAEPRCDDPLATRPEQGADEGGLVLPPTIGRFRVLGAIGMGGSGVVLAAHDPELDRAVALKIVAAADPDAQRTLLHEARAAARLAHEHVVAIYDVGVVGDRVWIAMERVDGADLDAWLATPRPLSLILDVFAKAGRGLAVAHRAGIVHRDFKPANVLVGHDGRVRVADFGLARLEGGADEASSTDTALATPSVTQSAPAGTPAYMAPEQLAGEPVGPAADQFAFCAALYRAITAQHPFAGDGPASWLAEMNDDRVRAWPRGRRGPGWLQRLVERGLRRHPRERFASMDALLLALDRGRGRPALVRRWTGLGLAAAAVAVVALVWTSAPEHRGWRGRAPAPAAQRASAPTPAGLAPLREQRVTANASDNNVLSAAISPDGQRIAWTDKRGKLFVRVLETGEIRAITAPGGARPIAAGVDLHPVSLDWTPDGTRLVFAEREGDDVSLWSVSMLGGAPSKLAAGCQLAAVQRIDGRIACVANGGRAIEIVDGRGGRSRVAEVRGEYDAFVALAWSPDGQHLAYAVVRWVSRTRRMAIETVPTAGGAPRTVVDDERLLNAVGWTALAWLADGRLLYALSDKEARSTARLWARPVHGDGSPGEPSLVGTVEGIPFSLSVTTDGARLAYVRLDMQGDVYVGAISPSGRVEPRRFTPYESNDLVSDFARDGALLFMSERQGRPASLLRQRLDEDEPTVLVPDLPLQAGVRVAPDGKGLVWFRPIDPARGRWELVAADEPTRSPRVVTQTREAPLAGRPQVDCARSPSGPCVIAEFAGGDRVFALIDPTKGRVREIARVPVPYASFRSWDLDTQGERILVAVAPSTDAALFVLSVHDGRLTPLPKPQAPCRPSSIAWEPGGTSAIMTCLVTPQSGCGLVRYHLDGRAETLWVRRSCFAADVHVAPDARHVAFNLFPSDTDVWFADLAR